MPRVSALNRKAAQQGGACVACWRSLAHDTVAHVTASRRDNHYSVSTCLWLAHEPTPRGMCRMSDAGGIHESPSALLPLENTAPIPSKSAPSPNKCGICLPDIIIGCSCALALLRMRQVVIYAAMLSTDSCDASCRFLRACGLIFWSSCLRVGSSQALRRKLWTS